jgi:hypothetical protein
MSQLTRRDVLKSSALAGAASAFPSIPTFAASANEEINMGFISCGGRAGGLMGEFNKLAGVNVAGLCDPDEGRLNGAKKRYPNGLICRRRRGRSERRGITIDFITRARVAEEGRRPRSGLAANQCWATPRSERERSTVVDSQRPARESRNRIRNVSSSGESSALSKESMDENRSNHGILTSAHH